MDASNNNSGSSRRAFLKKAGLGTAALGGLSLANVAANPLPHDQKIYQSFFKEGNVVLFQGDSITDAGRDKKVQQANHAGSLGSGYAMLLASKLLGALPEKNLTIYNRGISGNKVFQLAERWEEDCLELEPDILSILIGVNDYWHMRNGKYDGTPEVYADDFKKLLDRTLKSRPNLKLIICEPFILTNTKAVDESWVEPFMAYQENARNIAREYKALWIPFQQAFTKATESQEAMYWARDGVHPSVAGAQLMADTWIETVGKKAGMFDPTQKPNRQSRKSSAKSAAK